MDHVRRWIAPLQIAVHHREGTAIVDTHHIYWHLGDGVLAVIGKGALLLERQGHVGAIRHFPILFPKVLTVR